eukprot:GHVR01128913.1.p1 GENE.GHVR01128913.1~~GHVR01128913.1.p1  ORF type:complete len:268 (+),score=105.61 GHVR01128913.1:299-1102(+)
MSLYIATLNGNIVKSIVVKDFKLFFNLLLKLLIYSIPASLLNSFIDYIYKLLSLLLRYRLSDRMTKLYMRNNNYYQINTLDTRVNCFDHRICQDVEKWSSTVAGLFCQLLKPLVDVCVFSRALSVSVGIHAPLLVVSWYAFTGIILGCLSPCFGGIAIEELSTEANLRTAHAGIVSDAESIAFNGGGGAEYERVNNLMASLVTLKFINLYKTVSIGTIEGLLSKYGAFALGYTIIGVPVFALRNTHTDTHTHTHTLLTHTHTHTHTC